MEDKLRELEGRTSALERAVIRLQGQVDDLASTVQSDWLGIDGAAAYLGVSVRTVRRYLATGKLQAHRLSGRGLRFRREDLDAYLRPVTPRGGAPSGEPPQ